MYDITIIGAGISALFFSHVLLRHAPETKVLIIEKGNTFQNRHCPIELGRVKFCRNCRICNRMSGFGGLGKSEGKFNYTFDFGGHLHKKVGLVQAKQSMEEVDNILCYLGGGQAPIYDTKNEHLASKLPNHHYRHLHAKVRHLGTALSTELIQKLESELSSKMEIRCNEKIIALEKESGKFRIQLKNGIIETKKVIIATGQSGGDTFIRICEKWPIHFQKTRLDLGIRVEMPNKYLSSILSSSFETKIQYQHNGLTATTYCMNPRGRVVKKYQNGLVLADGQNYLQGNPTEQLNFTVFVPFYFSSPREAGTYAYEVISWINQTNERIVCQRYCDFLSKTPTSSNSLNSNTIVPTVVCESGNLWDVVPKACIEGLTKIMDAMRFLACSDIPPDTLLYGIDAKFYQPEISTDLHFQTQIPNLYVIGDCSGVTHSLSQAAASGVYLANHMLQS